MHIISQRWFNTLRYIATTYKQANCAGHAATLTIDTLLSVVPLLATSISLFAISPKLQHLILQAEHKLLSHFVANTGYEIQSHLENFARQASKVSLVGAGLLLITSLKLLFSLQQAFQAMLQVRIRQKTRLEVFFSCLAWVIAPIIVGLGIAMSSYIISSPLFVKHGSLLLMLRPLLVFLSIALSTLAFGFLYLVTPFFIVPYRQVFLGAFFAAVLFEASKWLFGLYVVYFPSYQVLYGVLAAIPLFILWIYLSWQIILLGAIVAQGLTYQRRDRSRPQLDGFTHAICWLGYLWQAKQQNQQLTMAELVNRDRVGYQVEPEDMLAVLKKLDFISVSKRGQYMLARDISDFSLLCCYQLLPWKLPKLENLQHIDFSWKQPLLTVVESTDKCHVQQLKLKLVSIFEAAS
jgi:membrane protein